MDDLATSHPWIFILFHFLRVIGLIAFVGVTIYSIIGGYYVAGAIMGVGPNRLSRKQALATIPKPIRKIGLISMGAIIASLAIACLLSLIYKLH